MSLNTKIELLGIKYYLGLGFLNELINGTGQPLELIGLEEDVALIPKLIYYSRLYAAKRLNLPLDFTLEDIYDYIDENGGIKGEFCIDFLKAYTAAMTQDVPQEEVKKKADKLKKPTS